MVAAGGGSILVAVTYERLAPGGTLVETSS
jgi:hypothetical protein